MTNNIATTKYLVELKELRQAIEEMLYAYHRTEGVLFGDHCENPEERTFEFNKAIETHRKQIVKNLNHSVSRLEKINF